MDADEFETRKQKILETPPEEMRGVQEYLARTMEQAQRDGNSERAESGGIVRGLT